MSQKLEPGMLCRVVGAMHPENEGKIVELVRWVGNPPAPGPWGGDGHWWEIDRPLTSGNTLSTACIPYANGLQLQPIKPDHQPADAEWQAEFRRMIGQNQEEKAHE